MVLSIRSTRYQAAVNHYLLDELLLYLRSGTFAQLMDFMFCDGLEELSALGFKSMAEQNKPVIFLSWVVYLSAVFNGNLLETEDNVVIQVILVDGWVGWNESYICRSGRGIRSCFRILRCCFAKSLRAKPVG